MLVLARLQELKLALRTRVNEPSSPYRPELFEISTFDECKASHISSLETKQYLHYVASRLNRPPGTWRKVDASVGNCVTRYRNPWTENDSSDGCSGEFMSVHVNVW